MLTLKKVSPLGIVILAIVVAEVLVFVPSTTEDFVTQSFVTPSPQASLSIQGFYAVHLNDRGQKETIWAQEAELFRDRGYTILREVDVLMFLKGDSTISIKAKKGKYFTKTEDLEFFDNIVITSENLGYKMRTEYLKYEKAKNLLWSDRKMWMAGPNPSKPSLIVNGQGMRANTQTEEMKLLSDVHCEKFDEGAKSIDIDSDHGTFYLGRNEALFSDNVVVKQKDMNIFADHFLVAYNNEDQSIDQAKAYDNVKIVQTDRVATCDTAHLLNREHKIVMQGHPKVVQGDDVVEGKVIIFYTAENKILFDEAVGEVNMTPSKKKAKKKVAN